MEILGAPTFGARNVFDKKILTGRRSLDRVQDIREFDNYLADIIRR